ncbi:FtsK/SpoIIIE domain-containing protein [Mycobacteroides abscessus]|uniref:FtsK/SpoIIIE domain-containing protein n=1 Tax=Mycobacteroides abscessus TaxID=36809 RepID=UPI00189656F2
MNTALESEKTRYLVVDKQGILTAPPQSEVAAVDQMDRSAAEAFAQRMAEYREANPGESVVDTETLASRGRDLTLSELLEIPDLETFDPRPGWEQRRWDTRMQIPLGTLYRDGIPTGTAYIKDLGSANNPGGEGVHGCYQGQSGSGKSVYLEDEVVATCAWHPPDKVNYMLVDFKGEASFVGFEDLPHVRGVVRDTGDPEILDRLAATIQGEIERRKRILGEEQARLGTNFPDVGKYLQFRAMSKEECMAAGTPYYREELKPLPVLIILIDEASIFYKKWKHEFATVFVDIVKQGRSVGVWIRFASQELGFLTAEQQLWAEMNYKSSLVVNSDNLSRIVLGGTGQEAYDEHVKKRVANYVKGGHIFFKFAGDDIVHLRAANNMLEYKKPGAVSIDRTQDSEAELVPFTLVNKWAVEDEGEESVPEPGSSSEKSTDGQIRTERSEISMLLKRLAVPVETELHDMWTPPLRKTVTLHQLDSFGGLRPGSDLNDLVLPVGIIDHPMDAAQSLMSVDFMRAGSVVVGGTGKSGRSMALTTLIVSSALRFAPRYLSWLLVDQGGDLGVVRKLPNIAGYARRGNTEMRDRIFSEIQRVILLRQRLFAANGLNSPAEYLQWRERNPVPTDPYGRLFVGFDGWNSLQTQLKQDDASGGAAVGWVGALGSMIEAGPTLGVHFVVTTDSSAQDLPAVAQKAVSPIYLRGAEHMTDAGSVAKMILKQYPANQPGLTVATSTLNGLVKNEVLRGRVAVPIRGDIPEPGPDEIKKMVPQDYSKEIIALCEDIARAIPAEQHIPVLAPLPAQLSFAEMWPSWRKAQSSKPKLPGRPQRNIDLPLGISSVDMAIAGIPWSVDTQAACAHTLCLGRPQSGRTTMLRTEIAAIVGSFAPHEAKVVIIDERGALNRERRFLAREHYLAGYGDREDTERVLRAVLDEVKRRVGTNSDLDEQVEEEQTYFDGPTLFVLVDNIDAYRAGQGSSPQAAQLLAEIIRVRERVDVHVIATATHDGFANESPRSTQVSPIAAMEEVRAHIVSLDATSRMKVRGELRAEAFPVPGRGYLISDFVPLSANGKPPIIQIAHLTGLGRKKMD